ncbi:hypothetical protein QJS66_14455 [Kocuria rhizophila]|nr:hypothetical protein QJS66_14455 [Kocuria rhizophila]
MGVISPSQPRTPVVGVARNAEREIEKENGRGGTARGHRAGQHHGG